jgi:hypothetical protein
MEEYEIELTDYELGFLRGVFAARAIVNPTPDQMREAAELMQLHSAPSHGEAN